MASSDIARNNTISTNESLEELNFRYAQGLIPFLVFNGLICAVGLVGNIFIIVVCSVGKDYRKTTFKVFALGLASVDLLVCLTIIPMEIIKSRTYFDYPNELLCKSKCALQLFTMTAAALTLLVICIDRYRATCKQFPTIIRHTQARYIICSVILVSLVLSIPAGILCGTTVGLKVNEQGYNTTINLCQSDERYVSSIWRYLYKYFMSTILTVVSIVFIVLYVLIFKNIYKNWKRPGIGGSIRMDDLVRSVSTASSGTQQGQDQYQGGDEVFSLSDSESNINITQTKTNGKNIHPMHQNSRHRSLRIETSVSTIGSHSRSFRKRTSSTPPGRISQKTVIWFVLTLVFLMTYAVYASLSFVRQSLLNTLSPGYMCVYQVFSRLHFVNSCINVFVYVAIDRKFLPNCKILFKRQKAINGR